MPAIRGKEHIGKLVGLEMRGLIIILRGLQHRGMYAFDPQSRHFRSRGCIPFRALSGSGVAQKMMDM